MDEQDKRASEARSMVDALHALAAAQQRFEKLDLSELTQRVANALVEKVAP